MLEKSDDFFRLYRQYAVELDSSRFSVTKFSCIFLYSTVVCKCVYTGFPGIIYIFVFI